MIRIRNLYKRFGLKHVLCGVDLVIEKGEIHVVMGRSGEGKSVLLKHICALLPYDHGVIEIEGKRVDPDNRRSIQRVRSRVSMVFQNAALFDSMTVRENVGFYLDQAKGKSGKEIDAIVERLLEEVNMSGTEHLYPQELSGGMRKRIGLARSLAPEPEIILYDEPTTGLDPVTTDVINSLILQTRERRGVTSVVVSHDLKSAYRIGDRISMLYRGKVVFTGTPEQVQSTDNPVVRQFVEGRSDGPITEDDKKKLATECEEAEARWAESEGVG